MADSGSQNIRAMRELIFINTLGLTGSEFIAAALSDTVGVRLLPGQNFIQYNMVLYRPHDYAGRSAHEVFAQLNREQIMRTGRCWMGLTKHMSPTERAAYDRPAHEREFCRTLGERRDFNHCVAVYAEAYFSALGQPLIEGEKVVICGGNFALNSVAYPDFSATARIVDVTNGIYTWLAMISQRMIFDCIGACQFWLVNRLWLARYAKLHPRYLQVALEDYHRDQAGVTTRLRQQLGLDSRTGNSVPPGLLRYNAAIIDSVLEDAADLRKIYGSLPLFQLAENFEARAEELLAHPDMSKSLDRYQEYWNSTGHTNFDVIGPIERRIISLLPVEVMPSDPDTSVFFYHQAFQLHSDHYDSPVAHWRHPLGMLEDEIEMPLLPFFLKIAIHYLRSIVAGYEVFLHSYVPVRERPLYRRLQDPQVKRKMAECGFSSWLDDLEKQIDNIEAHLSREGGKVS